MKNSAKQDMQAAKNKDQTNSLIDRETAKKSPKKMARKGKKRGQAEGH